MAEIIGTSVQMQFDRVVDGDTIRVILPAPSGESQSIRILCLDTEESNAGSSKPVTPWGKKAKEFAHQFFEGADSVTLEFPGNESFEECLVKHRDNYNRILAYVHLGDTDYQEIAIKEGYSPYFMKYGHAEFAPHRARYQSAEREAQQNNRGVWDQLTVNGSERRNYAALGTWWQLRGRLIDHYRALSQVDASLLDTRLHYEIIKQKAAQGESVALFTELRSLRRTRGGDHALVDIGSEAQPISFFVPNIDQEPGSQIVNLLLNRYIGEGESHPRRSYAFVTGELSLYPVETGNPQMVLTSVEQISDNVEARKDMPAQVLIAALLPNPLGADRGAETVTLKNSGNVSVSLKGWRLQDLAGHSTNLSGDIAVNDTRIVQLTDGSLSLNNNGDTVMLLDNDNRIVNEVSYEAGDVEPGRQIQFL